MSAALDDPVVRAWLAELRQGLSDRPADERGLVIEGVRQHIDDALGGGPADPEQVRRVLDGLGDPVAIAAESAPEPAAPVPAPAVSLLDRRGGAVLTVLVLVFGGLVVPVLGWVAGVVLLWSSRGWRTVDKVVGTVAAPVLLLLAAGTVLLLHATAGAAVAASDPSGGATSLGPLYPEPYDLIWGGLILAPLLQLAVGVHLLLRFQPRGRPRTTSRGIEG